MRNKTCRLYVWPFIIAYLVIGLVIAGIASAAVSKDPFTANLDSSDEIAIVLFWPMYIIKGCVIAQG